MLRRCATPALWTVIALRLTAALECENDVGGRFTLWPSGDAHLPSCLSRGAAPPCGPIARSYEAHEPRGPWRERPPSPRARYGFGTRWKFTPRPFPSGVAPAPTIPGGKAVRTPLWDAADQPDPPAAAAVAKTARAALLPAPARVVDDSSHPRRPWPRHRDPRLPLRGGPRPGFTARPRRPPVRGGRPTCRESECPRRERPPAFLQRTAGPVATRRGGLGWNCTSQPPQMPQQASKKAGRYDHVLRFRRGTAAPEAVAQPQAGQGHARSPSCTSERRFRAHRPRFHMCGSIRARLRRFGTSSSLPRRSQASSRKERLNHRSRLEDRLLLQR